MPIFPALGPPEAQVLQLFRHARIIQAQRPQFANKGDCSFYGGSV